MVSYLGGIQIRSESHLPILYKAKVKQVATTFSISFNFIKTKEMINCKAELRELEIDWPESALKEKKNRRTVA